MAWDQRAEHYSFENTSEGMTGTRGYRTATGGALTTAQLPQIGTDTFTDADGNTYSNMVCVGFREKFAKPGDVDNQNPDRVYTFKTPGPGGNENKTPDAAQFNIRGSIGGELHDVDLPENAWKWEGTSTDVDVPIPSRVPTGTFTRTVYGITTGQFEAYITKLEAYVGRINNAKFLGRRIGSVLYNGASFQSYYNAEDDAFLYQFDHEFEWRIIPNGLTAVTKDDWRYILDPDSGTWKIPVTKSGGNYMFDKVTMDDVFTP